MLYDGESVREVLQDVWLICIGRRFATCLVGWCGLLQNKRVNLLTHPSSLS